MSYDLSIQPKDSQATARRSFVDSFIASLPGVQQQSPGEFAYENKRQRLFVDISTGDSDPIDSIDVSVPAAFTGSSSEQALLLCFQIAEHLGWQVFDPQLGDFLDKRTAVEVLASQTDNGDTADEDLHRRSKGEASFGQIFSQQFSCHSGWVLIPTLLLATLVAGYFVVQHGVAENRFPLLFPGTALALHIGRALFYTIRQRIRDEKKRSAS